MACHHDVPALQARLLCALLLRSGVLLIALLGISEAQMTLDGSLGPQRTLTGPNYRIGAELGQTRGSNLFHSFGQFNVPTGGSATFTGPSSISNILSRVTGGQRSEIHGTLRSEIPGANLYLLNPSGVLFGPNASLDISGSFHVSTADYLRLADGARFSARLSETSTLSVAPPVAFGFLGPPAGITVEGSTLAVLAGNAMSAVGGDIRIEDGILRAPSGQVHLVSVASMGEVRLDATAQTPTPEVSSVDRLGTMTIKGSLIDASGNGGGTVRIRGGHLLVDEAFVFADTQRGTNGMAVGIDMNIRSEMVITNGSFITSDTFGTGRAGEVRIAAESLRLEASTIGSRAQGQEVGAGAAGTVTVQARAITLADGAQISGSTFGPGQGGTVAVTAADTLMLQGTSGIFANTGRRNTAGTGAAGTVTVQARAITLADGANIASATFGPGQGGLVIVTAADTLTLRGTSADGTLPSAIGANAEGREAGAGNAGAVVVHARAISLMDGAQIASDTFGEGRGGELTISAREAITLAGRGREGNPSGLFSRTEVSGDAGRLSLSTPRLTLTGGAQIDTSTRGKGRGGELTVSATDMIAITGRGSGLFSNTFGAAAGGNLFVSTPLLQMDNGVIRAETSGDGNAGNIEVRVERLTLTGGAQIFNGVGTAQLVDGIRTFRGTGGPGRGGNLTVMATEAIAISGRDPERDPSGLASNALFGPGSAGNLFLSAPTLQMDGGRIQATTSPMSSGDAGDIEVRVGSLLSTGGEISSRTDGPGRGGQLAVSASHIQLRDGSFISARSLGGGAAGTIQIQAGEMFRSQNSAVTTESIQAGGGMIVLDAGRLVQLRDSALATSVRGGGGDAGNLTVNAPFIVAGGSQIVANAFEGQGGNIRIQAQTFLRDPASLVDASSALGINGQVNIQAPVTSLSGAVAPLPQAFAQTTELLRSRCAERLREGTVSRFVLGGRDGVPLEPGSLLLSPLARVDQEDVVTRGEHERQPPAAQHGGVTSAQAHARGAWEVACARGVGKPKAPGTSKRSR